jgi:hypothetical protein
MARLVAVDDLDDPGNIRHEDEYPCKLKCRHQGQICAEEFRGQGHFGDAAGGKAQHQNLPIQTGRGGKRHRKGRDQAKQQQGAEGRGCHHPAALLQQIAPEGAAKPGAQHDLRNRKHHGRKGHRMKPRRCRCGRKCQRAKEVGIRQV